MRDPSLRPAGSPTSELVRRDDVLPTFVIGSVRSGTSAIMASLRQGAGLPGFNEGVLAHLLPRLLSAVRQHYAGHHLHHGTMLGSVPEEFLATEIKNLFGKAFVETMGTGRWLDKTPGGRSMIEACPSLLEIFPRATFIFCKRRGIENVLSRQNKFKGRDFETHCQGWAQTMETWLQVAPLLGQSAIAIDQSDMALKPEQVAAEIADLLKLGADQRDGIAAVLRGRRLEQTRPVQDDMPIALRDTGWSNEEQEVFRRVCGPMMAAFGYDMGEGAETSTTRRGYQFFVPVTDGVVQRENISDRRACRSLDAVRFKIDANPAGQAPAGVRHSRIDLTPYRRFSAEIRAVGRGVGEADGVIFRFALSGSENGSLAYEAERTVKAGPAVEWVCELPDLSGAHDAVLSVRPVSSVPTSERVSSQWINARLS